VMPKSVYELLGDGRYSEARLQILNDLDQQADGEERERLEGYLLAATVNLGDRSILMDDIYQGRFVCPSLQCAAIWYLARIRGASRMMRRLHRLDLGHEDELRDRYERSAERNFLIDPLGYEADGGVNHWELIGEIRGDRPPGITPIQAEHADSFLDRIVKSQILLKRNEPSAALDLLDALPVEKRCQPDVLVLEAEAAWAKGEKQSALEYLGRCNDEAPWYFHAHRLRCDYHFQLRQHEQGLEAGLKAMRIDPGDYMGYFVAGVAALMLRKPVVWIRIVTAFKREEARLLRTAKAAKVRSSLSGLGMPD